MPTYRTFCNADPPVLAALWQSRAQQLGVQQPIDVLEQAAFAKLYFDREGLILAHDDGRPVGFAHAGFGPREDMGWISTRTGATCVVLTRPGCREAETADGLLERCENYLRARGAEALYGGGFWPSIPFYAGLYGGGGLPGVLDSDTVARDVLVARGYREVERTALLRLDLGGLKPRMDRGQMRIRRQMVVETMADAPASNWWEASVFSGFELTRFTLKPRGSRDVVAAAVFRDVGAGGAAMASQTASLIKFSVEAAYRRRGLAAFLLGEAFSHFQRQGVERIDAQTSEANPAVRRLLQKFGFQPAAEGGVWKKDA